MTVGLPDDVRKALLDLRTQLVSIGQAQRIGLVDMLTEFVLIGKGEMVMTLRQAQDRRRSSKAAAQPPVPVASPRPEAAATDAASPVALSNQPASPLSPRLLIPSPPDRRQSSGIIYSPMDDSDASGGSGSVRRVPLRRRPGKKAGGRNSLQTPVGNIDEDILSNVFRQVDDGSMYDGSQNRSVRSLNWSLAGTPQQQQQRQKRSLRGSNASVHMSPYVVPSMLTPRPAALGGDLVEVESEEGSPRHGPDPNASSRRSLRLTHQEKYALLGCAPKAARSLASSVLSDSIFGAARTGSTLRSISLRRRQHLEKQLGQLVSTTPLSESVLSSSVQSQAELAIMFTSSNVAAANARVLTALDTFHYGIEFEALVVKPSTEMQWDAMYKAKQDFCPFLNEELGEERCNFMFYDCAASKADRVYAKWKVTTDSSITSEDGRPIFGFEIVSPKLLGLGGLRTACKVGRAMQAYGCATNNSTALHVHVSCQHLSNHEIKQLLQWYLYFEFVIDKFHSFPRRGDASKYCRSMVHTLTNSDATATAGDVLAGLAQKAVHTLGHYDVSYEQGFNQMVDAFNARLAPKLNSGRNHKVNATLLKGTSVGTPTRRVEFRQHAGSCDADEISMWTRFCVVLVATLSTVATSIPDVEATPGTLWEILDDAVLEEYYTRKQGALPEAPVDFRPLPRESPDTATPLQFRAAQRLQLHTMLGTLGVPYNGRIASLSTPSLMPPSQVSAFVHA